MAEEQQRSYVKFMLVTVACIFGIFAAIRFGYYEPLVATNAPAPSSNEADAHKDHEDIEAENPALTSTTPATTIDTPSEPIVAPQDVETLSYAKANFFTYATSKYTVVFSDRGAVLNILRFIDKDGEIVYSRSPLDPMETPSHPLQLLGRQLTGDFAGLKPETYDPTSTEFANYWRDDIPATFGMVGSEAWRNNVRWSTQGIIEKDHHAELTFVSPADAAGLVITKRFLIYDQFKVACELELQHQGSGASVSPDVFLYGPTGIAKYLPKHQEAGVMALYESGGGLAYEGDWENFQTVISDLADYNEEREEEGKPKSLHVLPTREVFEPDDGEQLMLHGLTNGYFISAIGTDYIPRFASGKCGGDIVRSFETTAQGERVYSFSETFTYVTYNFPSSAIPAGKTLKRRVALYAGPNLKENVDAALLAGNEPVEGEEVTASWSDLVPTGWPLIISGPITWLLSVLKDWIGSVGVAVILLTIIVRLCMSPLSVKAQISMQVHGAKVKKVKPKLDEIRAKYKDDKSREAQMLMFQETRAVMKSAGAGFIPLGGCLPLLLQMPIFFALYSSVRHSFLLYQEEFLWIRDLSRPDALAGAIESSIPFITSHGYLTFNVLPLIWLGMMFLMQLRAPKASDQQQRQMQIMMKFMPIMMGIFFYAMPAGFVLYFVASIIFSFIESTSVRRYLYAKGIIDDPRGTAASPMSM